MSGCRSLLMGRWLRVFQPLKAAPGPSSGRDYDAILDSLFPDEESSGRSCTMRSLNALGPRTIIPDPLIHPVRAFEDRRII